MILESIWPFIGPPKNNPDPSLAAQPKRDSGSSWEGYGGALGSGRALGRLWKSVTIHTGLIKWRSAFHEQVEPLLEKPNQTFCQWKPDKERITVGTCLADGLGLRICVGVCSETSSENEKSQALCMCCLMCFLFWIHNWYVWHPNVFICLKNVLRILLDTSRDPKP